MGVTRVKTSEATRERVVAGSEDSLDGESMQSEQLSQPSIREDAEVSAPLALLPAMEAEWIPYGHRVFADVRQREGLPSEE